MSQDPFCLKYKPLKISSSFSLNNKKTTKRTLGIRDKQILYNRAKGKCEACEKKIGFDEMHAGHKIAASKGGSATMRNSVCLCARCNKLQGTDSWSTFMRKMGKTTTKSVTSVKHKKPVKKVKKIDTSNYVTNPFTGKKEKANPLFSSNFKW